MCAVLGIICLISGAFPQFEGKEEALRVTSGALVLPALAGGYLLRRLKREFLREAAERADEEKA